MNISKIIKSQRKNLNLTLKEIAMYVGVNEATVSRWESGEIENIKSNKIAKLSQILQTPISDLIKTENKIGNRIKLRRCELNLSVDELAEKIGKDRATIYRYENNEIQNIPITILRPLAKALQTTESYLIGSDLEKNIRTFKFKDRLIEAMKIRNMKSVELAKKSGLSKAQISQYVNGVYEAKQNALHMIAIALNVNEAWLIGEQVNMERNTKNYTQHEQQVIIAYRNKPEMQLAIDTLLGINK